MAKELPYYKHEPSLWLEGEIQACSDAAIVCFLNLCSGYWIKLGCISYAFALHKYCRKSELIINELIDTGIIDLVDGNIQIKFLDSQLKEFNSISSKRSEAANKRWSDANALQVESKSNAIREEEIREDKKKEDKIITNNIKDRKLKFAATLEPYLELYGREMLNDFYAYWTEPNKSNSKFKQEMQKTWSLKLRLSKWAENEKFYNKNNNIKDEKFTKQQAKLRGLEELGNAVRQHLNRPRDIEG